MRTEQISEPGIRRQATAAIEERTNRFSADINLIGFRVFLETAYDPGMNDM